MTPTTAPAIHNGVERLPNVLTEAQASFLQQRTPPAAIRTRKGRGGQTFRYLTQAHVVRTLNEGFGFNWDFEIDWQEVGRGEVIARGRLTVRTPTGTTISKAQYGGSEIKKAKDGTPLSMADDLKAAASDALKKCASLLGLDLYEDGSPRGELPSGEEPPWAKA